MPNAEDKLTLARHHLDRVRGAWDTPTGWDDLSLYGFYRLEAAVEAAAIQAGLKTSKKHWEKADVAGELHKKHGLPNVEQLLHDLNDARKSAAYGDVPAPNLNAEDVASDRTVRRCRRGACGRRVPTMKHTSQNLSGHAPAEVLRWPTERSRDWTCRFVDSARAHRSIVAVVAIGSAVRPNVASADLDLIVICADTGFLRDTTPLEIDLRSYFAADVDAQIESGHDLLGWGIKFGKALFQRNHYWDSLVDSWRDRLPLPSSAVARDRAASAHRRLAKVLEFGDADASQEQAVSYLTHLARAELLDRGVYPASRPELPSQLRAIGSFQIAEWLDSSLQNKLTEIAQIDRLLKVPA